MATHDSLIPKKFIAFGDAAEDVGFFVEEFLEFSVDASRWPVGPDCFHNVVGS